MRVMKAFTRIIKILQGTVLFSILLMVSSSCEEKVKYDLLTGKLFGTVTLRDQATVVKDAGAVGITVEGISPKKQVLTDKDGGFLIEDLQTGSYNLVFSKEGYTRHKLIGYQFVGGNIPVSVGNINLFKIQDIEIHNLSLSDAGNADRIRVQITAQLEFTEEINLITLRFFLSDSPDVSYDKYLSSYGCYYNSFDKDLQIRMSIDTLLFPAGSELYMICYPAGNLVSQAYTDINSGCYIYSSTYIDHASNIANIRVPHRSGK